MQNQLNQGQIIMKYFRSAKKDFLGKVPYSALISDQLFSLKSRNIIIFERYIIYIQFIRASLVRIDKVEGQ